MIVSCQYWAHQIYLEGETITCRPALHALSPAYDLMQPGLQHPPERAFPPDTLSPPESPLDRAIVDQSAFGSSRSIGSAPWAAPPHPALIAVHPAQTRKLHLVQQSYILLM